MPRHLVLFAATVLIACGGTSGSSEPSPTQPDADAEPTRGISVRLTWDGERDDAPVATNRIPECAEAAPSGALKVGPDGGLADALVVVGGATGDPKEPIEVTMTARACRFDPRVVVVPPSTPMLFANADSGLHTFHLYGGPAADENVQNLAVPPGSRPARYVLKEAGRYRVVSDRYPWIEGWIQVAPNGTAGVTDAAGRLELSVRPGDYPVEVFHPKAGSRTRRITVDDDAPAALHSTLKAQEPGDSE